eukprot:scaffold762_cov363-Pavlova_lutheri.AAC.80
MGSSDVSTMTLIDKCAEDKRNVARHIYRLAYHIWKVAHFFMCEFYSPCSDGLVIHMGKYANAFVTPNAIG